jgi:hypothetical protein
MSVAAQSCVARIAANLARFRHSAHSRKLWALQFFAHDYWWTISIMSSRFSTEPLGNQISGNPRHRLEVSRPLLPFPPLLHSRYWNQPFPLSSLNSFNFVVPSSPGENSGLVGARMEGINGMSTDASKRAADKISASFCSVKLLSGHARGSVLPCGLPGGIIWHSKDSIV